MLFQSFEFIVHFGFLLLFLYLIPLKYRSTLLLLFSYYFYLRLNFIFIIPLLIITFTNYFIALKISKNGNKNSKIIWVIISLVISITLLAYFKITSSFGIKTIFQDFLFGGTIGILVPIGISFYTFQTIAYIIDVYKGRIEPEKSIIQFSLFVSFFPQVLAGPIERAKNLLPQLKDSIHITFENVYEGIKLFLWGFFKKVLVADKLSLLANPVFNQPNSFTGIQVIIGVISFSFQIYCDFSGYCDMGLGIAKALGIDLSINFYRPYTATSLRDFWQRWHISLTKWLRTFIYIPLGGSNVSSLRWIFNLLIIFCLSGLWHGITVTFIIWGCLHFILFSIERLVYDKFNIENKIPRLIKQIVVFSLVSFAWIFFKSSDVSTALTVIRQMLNFQDINQSLRISDGILQYGVSMKLNLIQIISVILPFLTYIIFEFFGFTYSYLRSPEKGKINFSEVIFLNIVFIYSLLFITETSQQFIYFKF
jgi:alginate O-acetyltransferase complex protein AlgI